MLENKETDYEELTGPEAIQRALQEVDLDLLEKGAREELAKKKKSTRKPSIQMLQAVDGVKKSKVSPSDLMISKIPVIPPLFRPYAITGDTFMAGHSNELYRDLLESKKGYEGLKDTFGDEGAREAEYNLYNATRALYGYGDAVNPKTKARGVSGFMSQILGGGSPKYSIPQRRLFSKTTDAVSRSVITIDPELDIDQIGIPRHIAMKQYSPHVQRKLVQMGYSNMDAIKHIKDGSKTANKVLEDLTQTMPVVYSRSPAWHKYNVIGGWATLTDGDSISTNPYVMAGLSGDFDGDLQVNTILLALPRSLVSVQTEHKLNNCANNVNFCLTGDLNGFSFPVFGEQTLETMNKTFRLPVLDTTTHVLTQVDLADFPHGDLAFETEGTCGPIYFYHALAGSKVISRDDNSGKLVWADVQYFSVHPFRTMELVNLKNGNTIYTDNDKRAIYGMDPKDPDMRMRRFTPTEAWNKNVQIPFARNLKSPLECLETKTHINITDDESCSFKDIKLDFNFGWFLGALAGDGWWDKKPYKTGFHTKHKNGDKLIHLADLKGFVVNKMASFFRNELKISDLEIRTLEQKKENDTTRYGDTVKHTFSFSGSSYLADFLTRELGGEASVNSAGSKSKKLPSFFLNTPEEFRRGLITGLIDTDGSCSVSMAKDSPQLLINLSSTSLRLLRETTLLLKSLNVQSSITFAKLTSRYNESWTLNISTVDAKNTNLLAGLATDYKLKTFVETAVYTGPGPGQKFNRFVFPNAIYELFKRHIICPKITKEERNGGLPEEELKFRKKHQNAYQTLNSALVEGSITQFSFNVIVDAYAENRSIEINNISEVCKALRSKDPQWLDNFDLEKADKVRRACRSVAQHTELEISGDLTRILARTARPLAAGCLNENLANDLLAFLTKNSIAPSLTDVPIFLDWYSTIITNTEISWTSIESVEYTDQPEDGYDLTVPGYETFMALDGTILSNTVTIHLPTTKESQEEAKDILMPSKMVLSTKKENTIVPTIKHEQILGLYTAKNKPSQNIHTFNNRAEALAAVKSGQVRLSDEIKILNEK
jgi:DNA-directed RNA polymerase beta' subunit